MMLRASVQNHALVEIAVNVLVRKIAMPTHPVRNLNLSFVDHHWRTQASLVLCLAQQAGQTLVLLESLASRTRRAKVTCHRFLSLQLRLRLLRNQLRRLRFCLQLRRRLLRNQLRLRRISQQSTRLRILHRFQQINHRINHHPNQLPIQRVCQQRIRRIIRQRCQRIFRRRCQRNILPSFRKFLSINFLLCPFFIQPTDLHLFTKCTTVPPALPRHQLFQSSSMFQKSLFIVVSISSMQLKSAVSHAQTGFRTALSV
jgi:hypothetical protein